MLPRGHQQQEVPRIICPTTPSGSLEMIGHRGSSNLGGASLLSAQAGEASENDPPPAAGRHSGFRGSDFPCPQLSATARYSRCCSPATIATCSSSTNCCTEVLPRWRAVGVGEESMSLQHRAACAMLLPSTGEVFIKFTAQRLDKSTVNKVAQIADLNETTAPGWQDIA